MIDNQIKQKETDDKLTVKDLVKDDEPERNEYFCPLEECDKTPEIVNALSEIGKIILRCGKYNKLIYLDVDDYFDILDNKKNKIDKNNTKYCISINNENNEEQDNENILINVETNSNQDKINNLIDDEKKSKKDQTEIFDARKKILDKNTDLCNIIRALNQLIDTQEKHPENYLHNQNVLNEADFIEKENKAFHKTDEKFYYIDNVIEEIKNNQKEEIKEESGDEQKNQNNKEKKEDILEQLKTTYKVYLTGEEHVVKELHLTLKGQKDDKGVPKYPLLKNDGFNLISQIRFKKLIEINVANNEISDITPLNNMLLPYLEIINLSDNQIQNIQPVADLCSENLLEIYLHNNIIEDLGPFLNSHFDHLEILRVDNNEKAIQKTSFQELQKNYGDILFYEAKNWKDFIQKYDLDLSFNDPKNKAQGYLNMENLDLSSKRCGDIILKDLYPLIIYPNKIKNLILDDNKLQDVSLLSRMPLYNLKLLDLSLNFISNIKFLKKLAKKCKHLEKLYLNDNKINDISPLIKYEEGNKIDIIIDLRALTLKNNCLDLKEKTTENILKTFIEKAKKEAESRVENAFAFDYDDDDFKDNDNKKSDKNNNKN